MRQGAEIQVLARRRDSLGACAARVGMGVGGVGALVERGSRRVLLEATCRPANRRVVESACEEVADRGRDLRGVGLEREVARVEEMDSRTGNIASERLGTARHKDGIILS